MGISGMIEGEEGESLASSNKGDRLELNLPENQVEYLKKLREGNEKPLIVVITGGSPMTIPEVEELADAILWVWYPGQEGGNAVADVIFGNESPSGKLPLTFPLSVDQLPDYEDYSMVERTYRYMTSKPLYPFGYGLSYTKFSFNDLYLDKEEISAGETLTVSVDVKNSGDIEADEVVQLYITVPDQSSNQPLWALKKFERITLKKGASTTVSFELTAQDLEQFNEEGKIGVLPGEYTVYIGNGSPGERSQELGVQLVSTTFRVN